MCPVGALQSRGFLMISRFKQSGVARQLFWVSPVTLGVARLGLASLLLCDLFRRWADLDIWYTNAGLMPNHTLLWAPQAKLGFSIFYSVSQLHEARFFVLLIACIYVLLLFGFRTRLMQVLALLAHVSLNCRIHYLTNGGDVALSVLLLWTAFLPLGQWLSVDAFLNKMKHSRVVVNAKGLAELQIDSQHANAFEKPGPQFEWAIGGVVLQLAVIYFFNYIHKDGAGWREGLVVQDVLHQDRIVTALGVWLRPYLTADFSAALTHTTLFVEGLLPALLLLPLHSIQLRRLSIFLGLSLHVGFAAFINLGVFSFAMCCFWLLLLPHEDITRFINWLRSSARGATLYFDSDCGICGWCARALLCMQYTSVEAVPSFTVKGNEAAPGDVRGVSTEHVEASVLWLDGKGKQHWHSNAFAAIASSFPLTRPLAWLFNLSIAKRFYFAFAKRRHQVSSFFGLGTCGIRQAVEPFPGLTDARKTQTRWAAQVRHGVLVFVFVVFTIQVLAQNRAVPQAIKPVPPWWVVWPVEYLHFFQGWGMFAHSPRTDSTVVVRAVTVDGRKVDPLSERASPRSLPGAQAIVDRLDHDEFFCDYLSRIADDRAYHPPLRDWILAYPKRTGNAADAIASFEVVQLTDVSPLPGQTESTQRAQRIVMTYP